MKAERWSVLGGVNARELACIEIVGCAFIRAFRVCGVWGVCMSGGLHLRNHRFVVKGTRER